MRTNYYTLYAIALTAFVGLACEQKETELVWDQAIYKIGSQSSPRATDLNQDGVLDIVMGAGEGEIDHSDYGVIALDGSTGELLWKQEAHSQMVGSATFYDITQDSIMDILIGGRERELKALDGKNGEIIWAYTYQYEDDPILRYAKFNFYNGVLIPDQNGDKLPELLTVNGGNWRAAADSPKDRYPGLLMIFDITNGSIIAADTMPDGKESYMSPVCIPHDDEGDLYILFGTGGETIEGSLYLTTLSQFMEKGLSQSDILISEQGHGYIAPPSIADINEDGVQDILSISHASTITALDGKSFKTLWKRSFAGLESSNSMAVGYFYDKNRPDLLAVMSEGIWPNYHEAHQVLINSEDGSILRRDTLGCFSLSSPVVYDLDRDGLDEAIVSINDYNCDLTVDMEDSIVIEINNSLVYMDFQRPETGTIDTSPSFKNFFSTPWIGELDQDGYLDIVYPQYFHGPEMHRFMGMKIKRISTSIRIQRPVVWGGYMGSQGDGVFNPFQND